MRRTIQHVLKDDRVQSLLQQGVGSPSTEGQCGASEEISAILVGAWEPACGRVCVTKSWCGVHPVQGPKLTRAQVKKSLEEGHPMDPLSPLKMVGKECTLDLALEVRVCVCVCVCRSCQECQEAHRSSDVYTHRQSHPHRWEGLGERGGVGSGVAFDFPPGASAAVCGLVLS